MWKDEAQVEVMDKTLVILLAMDSIIDWVVMNFVKQNVFTPWVMHNEYF